MNYQETIAYLYDSAPLFQHVGKEGYKEGLDNTLALDRHLGSPHKRYHTLHIAGTNGKGSCAHTLAAILQSAGYRTGLYTSPHLKDFRERIRINGVPVSEDFVTAFVAQNRPFFEPLHPSFFELTTAMAFSYFADEKVDVAVIETGLGGRLDCTNIIRPDLCLITNISYDHTQFLGHTLSQIAAEKAGIIKEGIPAIIGEAIPETRDVFLQRAASVKAPLFFAEEEHHIRKASRNEAGPCAYTYDAVNYPALQGELGGFYQEKNANTILSAVLHLQHAGYALPEESVRQGFAHVCELTGLEGRWQLLATSPTIVCDTGHNAGGMRYIAEQLQKQHFDKLHIIIGMVNDKDIDSILSLLPKNATYYFTQASVKRSRPAEEVRKVAEQFGLRGDAYTDVATALKAAKGKATERDFIFIGGSSYIVADLLSLNS